jgi:FkbM family methyltransferase
MLASLVIKLYSFWHGNLHLKGAGRLISWLAPHSKGLQNYPFKFPSGKIINIDFRELSAFGCLNTFLGDPTQEDVLIDSICSMINENSVFWDIGSNAGILSYLVAKRQPHRELRFFEPNPELFKWAETALSHLPIAKGHQIAISNYEGKAILSVPLNKSAYGSLEMKCNEDNLSFEVSATTADSLCYKSGFSLPDVVKIDTEGHELAVIEGMEKIIKEKRPIIFFEHIELTDEQIKRMVPDTYTVGTVCEITKKILPQFSRNSGHNSVLIPLEKLAQCQE